MRLLGVLLACGLLLGCGDDDSSSDGAAPPAQDRRVDLEIVRGRLGTVRPVVEVSIAGQGPYDFLLDTGSEKTTVDLTIARELGLERLPTTAGVGGIAGGSRQGRVVRLARWRAGSLSLPATRAVAIDLPDGEDAPRGLLGSDVLSQFGTATVDYRRGVLTLGTR